MGNRNVGIVKTPNTVDSVVHLVLSVEIGLVTTARTSEKFGLRLVTIVKNATVVNVWPFGNAVFVVGIAA